MFPSINSYSILYVLFAWLLGMCYGFVLLSSAAGHNSEIKLFERGESLRYRFHSTVLLNEKSEDAKNVGFYIAGDVVVGVVWAGGTQKLLKMELISPQLNIRSRKAPSPDGFIPHTSKLDTSENRPFLVVWNNGKIDKVLLSKEETTSMKNLKKGIASLFQFQLLDGETSETDASGLCTITYSSSTPSNILKTKTACNSTDFRYLRTPDEILGVELQSTRSTKYEIDASSKYMKTITSREKHSVFLSAIDGIGNQVETEQILTFVNKENAKSVNDGDLNGAIENVGKAEKVLFTQETLLTEKEDTSAEVASFAKQIDSMREYLKSEKLGTLQPAKAFAKLVSAARTSTKEVIAKALGSKKNKHILPQIYDILGYAQTDESHAAVMKVLHFDKEEQIDLSERYLWALSFSSQPNPNILQDLLKKYTKIVSIPDKVKETLILTIGSMAHRLTKLANTDHRIAREAEELILNNLDYAKDEERFVFFRALKNLQSPRTIPVLLGYIKNGTLKEGVWSWKVIKSFNPEFYDESVLKAAIKSLFQLDRKHDTSSRSLAVDILLESHPSDHLLTDLLNFLISNDTAYEIKQYVLQRIKMLGDNDPAFQERVTKIIKSNYKINNYSGLSPRGLSTALSRKFFSDISSNGSLVSVQEIKSGIVKRGTVDVVMERNGVGKELFSLGIFSGGLHSFVSSDETEEAEDETATAGLELTVLGTQIRPFVFFNGQGELMGHVWSGTASERTPAFQVLALIQDNLESFRLGSGFIAELDFKGATSFDLSGKIETSLWNRNAESLVEKSAGIVLVGSTTVDTTFVKSQVEFTASTETKLTLQTDIDFSSNVRLCMRLTKPDALFRHNIFKIERIPGSKHKLRISKYKKSIVPGTTYSLNRKNNEMCSALFS